MKAVLWVSADGLRVVDDKTKVSKLFAVYVWQPSPCFVLLSVFPVSLFSTYLITHIWLQGQRNVCPLVMYRIQHYR